MSSSRHPGNRPIGGVRSWKQFARVNVGLGALPSRQRSTRQGQVHPGRSIPTASVEARSSFPTLTGAPLPSSSTPPPMGRLRQVSYQRSNHKVPSTGVRGDFCDWRLLALTVSAVEAVEAPFLRNKSARAFWTTCAGWHLCVSIAIRWNVRPARRGEQSRLNDSRRLLFRGTNDRLV